MTMPHKRDLTSGYDDVADALQSIDIGARQQDWIDRALVVDAETLTDTPSDTYSGWFPVKANTVVLLGFTWTTGWSGATGPSTLHLRILGNLQDADTNELQQLIENYDPSSDTYSSTAYGKVVDYEPDDGEGGAETPTTGTAYKRYLEVPCKGINRMKIQAWEDLGAGGTPAYGTLSVERVITNP